MLKVGFVDEHRLVCCCKRVVGDDTRLLHHPENGVDSLATVLEINLVGLSRIDAEGFGIPKLPVVVEQGRVERTWLIDRDESHTEEPRGLNILIAGLQHTDMRYEISRNVVTGQLDTVFEAVEHLEDGGGNALGSLALVIAREHTGVVGVVHSPAPSSDIH